VLHEAIPEFQMVAPAERPRLYARLLHDVAAGRLPLRRLRSNPLTRRASCSGTNLAGVSCAALRSMVRYCARQNREWTNEQS
jgi:hypothetical protein